MPKPTPPFVPVKTMAEEDAAAANLDALTPEEQAWAASQGAPAAAPADTTEGGKWATGFPTPAYTSAVPDTRARVDANMGGNSITPTGHAGIDAYSEAEKVKLAQSAAEKVAALKDKPGADAKLTPDEKAAADWYNAGQADMNAKVAKAGAESTIPTVLKPVVAAVKGVTEAVGNTATLAGIHEPKDLSNEIPDVGGATGGLITGVTQFAVGMKGMGAILGTGGGFAGSAIRGAATDFSVFDAHAERLSNLVEEHPALRNPITSFLAADPNDSEALGRLKNSLEGLGLGLATEGFTKALAGTKSVFSTLAEKGPEAAAKEAAGHFEEHAASEAKAAAAPATEAPQAAAKVPLASTSPSGEVFHGTREIFDTPSTDRGAGFAYFTTDKGTALEYANGGGGRRGVVDIKDTIVRVGNDSFTWDGEKWLSESGATKTTAELKANEDAIVGSKNARVIGLDLSHAHFLDLGTEEGRQVLAGLDHRGNAQAAAFLAHINKKDSLGKGLTNVQAPVWQSTKRGDSYWKDVFIPQLREKGYDGIAHADGDGAGRSYGVFNPEVLKPPSGAVAPKTALQPLKGTPPTADELAASLSKPIDETPIWNGDRIATTDEVRTVLQKVGETAKAATDDGVQHLSDVSDMADAMGVDHLDVREALAGLAPTVEKQNIVIQAARRVAVQIGKKVAEEGRKLNQGATTDRTVINNHLKNLQSVMETLLPARKAQSRGMGQWRTIASDEMSIQQLQDLVATGGDITKIRKINEAGMLAKTFDAYMQLRVGGLMSSPASHMKNFVSNVFSAVLKPATRAVGATARLGYNAATGNSAAALQNVAGIHEALGHYMGLIHGFVDSAKMAKMAWDVDASLLKGGSELRSRNAITSAKFGITPTSMLGQAVDAFGQLSNLAGRGLGTADEFASQINYRANVYATATQEALQKGITDPTELAYFVRGKMMDSLDSVSIPGKGSFLGRATDPKALQYALEATFQEKPGLVTQGAMAFAQKVPAIRSFVPFMKTLGNITRQGAEYTPAAFASTHWWSDLKAGGAKKDEAVGKLVLGAGMTVTTGALVHSGVLTGAGPHDPKQKADLMATGWRPYSIKIGDEYRSYRGFVEPLGTTLAMVSSLFERQGGWDEEKKAGIAAQVTSSVADAMLSQTFAQGITDLLDSVTGDDASKEKFARTWAASHIPALFNDVREATDHTRRSPQDLTEALKNRFPWLSEDVPAAYDALGNKRLMDYGMGPEGFSPVTGPFLGLFKSQDKHDEVLNEISRLQITPGALPRFEKKGDQYIDYTHFTNPKTGVNAYDRWNELVAGKSDAGDGLEPALKELMSESDYHEGTDEVKPGGFDSLQQIKFKNAIAAYRQETKGQLMDEYPDLQAALEQSQENRGAVLENGSKGLRPLLKK